MSDYFTKNTNVADQSFTFGDFGFSFTKNNNSTSNYNASDGGIRFYQNDVMTIDGNGKTMTSIKFTTYGGKNGPLAPDTGAFDAETLTWTGSAAKVAFTATAQIRFSAIEITYE